MTILVIKTIICAIIAHLLCGVSFGLFIGKQFCGVDLRKEGSGNPGFTNAVAVLGPKPAAFILLLDTTKGALAMLFATTLICGFESKGLFALHPAFYSTPEAVALAWVFCAGMIGNILSPWQKYRGGNKGIATGLGAFLVLAPIPALVSLAAFLIVAFATSYISIGSMTAAVMIVVSTAFLSTTRPAILIPLIIVSIVVIWAHRSNIAKLKAKTERSIYQRKEAR